ncbi:MAG: hypothetical protein ACLTSZ_18000 [Lachnospiraceae bacterium]
MQQHTWGELTGASLDVYTISDSGSPSQEIAARYAANNAPTLIMGDVQDVADICEEYGADLSNESWAANGGETYGVSVDGKLYSFPFCIEGRGLRSTIRPRSKRPSAKSGIRLL